MEIRKDILQKFIDENGNYLIDQRMISRWGHTRLEDEYYGMFLSPNVDRAYSGKKIGEMPFDDVERLANTEIMTNIHLGGTYPPFQYGILAKNFICLEKVTCDPQELIHECYVQKIKDYYKAIELMKKLTEQSVKKQ